MDAPVKLHSRYGPSAASRWMNCPGSIRLIEDAEAAAIAAGEEVTDNGSVYADEGTAAASLAEMCRESGMDAAAYIGRIITVESSGRTFEVTHEMASAIQSYLDLLETLAGEDGEILVEQRVEHGAEIGLPGESGTSDAIILRPKIGELVITDLKYGKGVRVEAEDNDQLLLYAIGARTEYEMLGDFETFRLVICQPRMDHVAEWVVTREYLDAAIQRFRRAVAATLEPTAPVIPGEKQCRWCPVKATCATLAEHVQQTVGADFDDLTVTETRVKLLEEDREFVKPNLIGKYLESVDLIRDWCTAVEAEGERRLLAGEKVPGWKLVKGRRGNRRWSDEAKAETALRAMRLKHYQMYAYSLISPTTAEELKKSEVIGPRQWPKLAELIEQPDGKPSLAPESDKRPAVTVVADVEDFDDVAADQAELDLL